MSAAKMVADSTQSDLVTEKPAGTKRPKSTDRKKSKTKKQKKHEKTSSKKQSGKRKHEEENDSDLDLEKNVVPIGNYIRDRRDMLDQMFWCLRRGSLQRAMPDALKELPLDNLKQKCLEHLEVMSRKRIRRILNGDDPATISSSGTEESSDEEQQQDENEETITVPDSQGVDSTVQASGTVETDSGGEAGSDWEPPDVEEGEVGSDGEVPEANERDGGSEEEEGKSWSDVERSETEYPDKQDEVEEGEIAEDGDGSEVEQTHTHSPAQDVTGGLEQDEDEDKQSELSDGQGNTVEEGEVEEEGSCKGDNQQGDSEAMDTSAQNDDNAEDKDSSEENKDSHDQTPLESLAPFLTQNQMELLELEMRARAIKSMLRSQKPP